MSDTTIPEMLLSLVLNPLKYNSMVSPTCSVSGTENENPMSRAAFRVGGLIDNESEANPTAAIVLKEFHLV